MAKIENNFNHNVFFEFEKKHSLFNLKNGDTYFWDIIRNDIYLELLWEYSLIPKNRIKRSVKQLLGALLTILKFWTSIFVKRNKYIFFTASRNKINGNQSYDQNLGDLLTKFSKESILLENFEENEKAWYYSNTVFNPIAAIRKICSFFLKTRDYSLLLLLLKNEYAEFNLSNHEINSIYKKFKIDLLYYSIIFRVQKPKAIFITQYGIQKGLFAAAKRLGIPVIEVQHGIIDEGHMAYSYNRNILYTPEQYYLPDYFLSFTDFWTKDLYMPVSGIIPAGNSAFAKMAGIVKNQEILKQDGLLVASSNIFGKNLAELIIRFARAHTNTPVYFKLHPDQFQNVRQYEDQFSSLQNVKIFTGEKSVNELLSISKAVLAIQSTAVYEALHSDKIAIIYKKQTYKRHSHIFNFNNVYLIDDEIELENALKQSTDENRFPSNIFFKEFDESIFFAFMTKLEHEHIR